ncbi:MAG: ATP-binding protein [Ruminococcaceae bacterium]|nr:ATP-binding protein [Oscillospiraceae bacterium]
MDNLALAQQLRHLVIFKNLRTEPLLSALAAALETGDAGSICDLAAELYPRGMNLRQAMATALLQDDNFCVREAAALRPLPRQAAEWLDRELDILEEALLASASLQSPALPAWELEGESLSTVYKKMLRDAPCLGYGIFSQYYVFSVSPEGSLIPIEHPDPQQLSELYGYETERQKLLRNTQALLQGLPANNVLLYGDAGTGKSSTVKALVNEYKDQGLRLIQVEKSRLRHIPALLDSLTANPLKFILFIDDLSFAADDHDYTALKTVLEGSVAARSSNTVVYATSNRRHLIQETFQSRQGDEIHISDTLEEVSSLSARFGIVITFGRPDKDLYLSVVEKLAEKAGLALEEALYKEAEAYALRAGGRSPRVARQYIEYKIAMDCGSSCAK